jgi:hypothetical protein
MPGWSLDDWAYLERQVVSDPKGREWTVAVMDILGQEGDPQMPSGMAEMQYASGRYFTLIYSSNGGLQRERGYTSLPEAMADYEQLLVSVVDGRLDPGQPVYREDLED